MESPAATSSRKRKSHQASLDDLEAEMAALGSIGRETQILSQISDNKYSDIMHSYLNRESQIPQETENELITMIHKAILEEKSCPSILPFQTELYQNLSEVLLNQEEAIKESKQTLDNKMFLNIYSLEAERTKYMLKMYLRIRLFKIQKYAIYILRNKQENLLSQQENTFLKQFFELRQTHFNENVLSHLPNTLRNLGLDPKHEKANNEYMVPEPDLDKAVLVRVIRGYEKFTLDVNNSQELNLVPGDIYCFKYKDIKNLHQKGMVEFI